MGFRRSHPRPSLVLPAVALAVLLLSGCGDDTATIALDAVGRPSEPEVVEPVELAMVEGLTACDEAELLTPDDDNQPYGEVSLNQETIAVLGDYAAAEPDDFAGMWLDARYSGLPLVAFAGDFDRHRRAILDLLPADRRGVSFSIAEALVGEKELERLAKEVLDLAAASEISSLRSTDLDLTRNRVQLDLVDATEDELEDLLDRLEIAEMRADLFCTVSTISPPIPQGPLDVLPGPDGARLVSCGDFSFPLASLLERTPIGQSDHPAAAVIAEYTADSDSDSDSADAGGSNPDGEWIVLQINAETAYFGKYRNGLEATAIAITKGGGWDVSGWNFGCELQVGLPEGLGAVEIFLDPSRPPTAASRTVRVLVSELACAEGNEMGVRLLGPQVIESETQILLAFAAVEATAEVVECPGNPLTAVDVMLEQPLGARSLANGMYMPPAALTNP